MSAEWFASKLKGFREKAGWSQQHLADRAGITQKAVSLLEAGARSPSWATVQALAGALGVSCEVFQDGETARPRPKGRPKKA